MRIEVTGGTGFIGGNLVRRLHDDDRVVVVDAIVDPAARPSVPRSIADPTASHHANATGTRLLELRPLAFHEGLEDTLAWFRTHPVYAGA